MAQEKISVEFSSIQLGALRSIILGYARAAPAHEWSYEWVDIVTDEYVTLSEVLTMILAACDRAPAARQVGSVGRPSGGYVLAPDSKRGKAK
jgi:hypothetical protein